MCVPEVFRGIGSGCSRLASDDARQAHVTNRIYVPQIAFAAEYRDPRARLGNTYEAVVSMGPDFHFAFVLADERELIHPEFVSSHIWTLGRRV